MRPRWGLRGTVIPRGRLPRAEGLSRFRSVCTRGCCSGWRSQLWMTADTPPGAGRLPAPPHLPPPPGVPSPRAGPSPRRRTPSALARARLPRQHLACQNPAATPGEQNRPPRAPGPRGATGGPRGAHGPASPPPPAPTCEGDARKTRTALRPNCRFDNIGKPRPIFM